MKTELLHQYFLKSSGICTDTRTIKKGCLFFALKGDNFNGNTFAQKALNKGAYKVIIDEVDYQISDNTLLCTNTLRTLQNLASFHRDYLKLPIIALTGSNGKTTTKELINAVLSEKYNTVATKGNLNNHIGVPLTLLSMDADTEIGIVEMGANHLKEIKTLCEIAKPDFGYITNFGKAHLEGFGSIEGVIKGKTELYRHLKVYDKTVFINANDSKQLLYSKILNKITFGNKEQNCSIQLKDSTQELILEFEGLEIKSNLIGLYNYHNIAAAICIGDYFKVSKENIKKAIENYVPTNNRSQLIEQGTNKIILDAYNANPSSMMVALENFKQTKGDHKILFLGDMFELGEEAEREHQNIVEFLEESSFEKTYLIGDNFFKTKTTSPHIIKLKTFDDLKKELEINSPKNSCLLIKASRGMALERILELI